MLTSCSSEENRIPFYNACAEEIESIDGTITWANRSKGKSSSYSIHSSDFLPLVPLVEGYSFNNWKGKGNYFSCCDRLHVGGGLISRTSIELIEWAVNTLANPDTPTLPLNGYDVVQFYGTQIS